MAYNAKTDWKYDDNITEDDVNRWEQGIVDAHEKADQAEQNAKAHADQVAQTAESNAKQYTDEQLENYGGTVTWEDIENKPEQFPPVPHNHSISDVDGLQNELDSKETPAGAQAKADQAEQNAKEYTDQQVADIEVPVTSVNDKTGDVTVTKEDVGLGNVINERQATKTEFDAHQAEIATQEQLGHVKAGQNITIDSDGTINAKGGNVDSVNGKTGEVVIDVPDIAGLVSSRLALGQNASAGTYSVALGDETSAAGIASIALGRYASAGGSYSVALGRSASAENDNEGILGGAEDLRTTKWRVPGSFTVSGTKNFEIPHPKPEKSATHIIRHGAVESPTPGDTLYRWKIQATKDNDLVTIDLPDYFVWLNKDVQIFVTGQGHFGNGYGELNRETEQLEIHCQFAGEYNVLVIGTRNDDHQSVQDWDIKGVEREIGESWTGETYVFEVEEIMEVEEIKEVGA